MKLLAVVGTAGLIFLLGNAAASVAQEPDKPEKHDDKAKPEKQEQPPKQDEKPPKQEPADKPAAKPENKPAKPEPVDKAAKPPAKPEQPKQVQQSQHDATHGNGTHGRIADDRYRASFGSEHHFHVQRSDYEHHRFAYGGYNFVFVDAWPGDWGYTDDVYVVYEDGVYYMYDVVHPGVHITLNISD